MAPKNDATVPFSANAAVNVDAKKSQSVIVILGIIAGILCVIGSFLIYVDKSLFWVPFLAAAVSLFACVCLALLTHRNTDLAGAHPTVIEVTGAGVFKFVTDPRVEVASKSIAPLVTILANMHSLPQASGLLDENLNPIPNTEAEAVAKVEIINTAAQEACADALSSLSPLPTPEHIAVPFADIQESEISLLTPQKFTPS
ncbi:TPA: hypothetical protein MIQ52_000389 [Klebsiella aerogenes]|nr:hypothetical protein [Klebsiella aerogenes]HBY1603482.1 hypothetical protein [Klebsiella aerogenes]HBY1639886.1 hypothetical protein [Klebsiella aerogenes]